MRYCEVCGSKNRERIFINVAICKNCGFAYNYICTQAGRTKYYKKMEKKSYYLSNFPVSPLYLKQQENTARFIKNHAFGKILDVGCFTGNIMEFVCGDIAGIDPSPTAVNISRSKGLKVDCGDIFSYRFKNKYDTIILSHVIEHIVDLKKFILIISELLNQDGIVIIETPDATKFNLEKSKNFINDQREPLLQFSYEHVNYFTVNSLRNLFSTFDCMYAVQVQTTIHAIRLVFKKRNDDRIKSSLESHIKQSLDEFKRISKKIETIKQPVYVWGLGAYTKKLLAFTNLSKLKIVGFIDNVYKKKKYQQIPVIKNPVKDIPIVIGSMQYADYVKKVYKNHKLITL